MLRRPAVVLPVLVAVPVLLLTACGSAGAPPGSTASPRATSSPGSTAPPTSAPSGAPVTDLAQARAAWAASPASTGEYALRITRSCFCAPVVAQTTVRNGTVSQQDFSGQGGASVSPLPDEGFPLTVEDLFGVVEAASDGYRVAVTYSRDGVPLRIDADPVKDGVDDEYGYSVGFTTMEGEPAPATADGSWRAEDPTGTVPGLDANGPSGTGSVAYVDRTGSSPVLRLGLWGSGSCPDRPVTLRQGTVQDGVVAVTVDVDGTQPAGVACTADYGPTWFAAPLPPALDDVLAPAGQHGPAVRLVLEQVLGSTGSTGSSARAVDVLR